MILRAAGQASDIWHPWMFKLNYDKNAKNPADAPNSQQKSQHWINKSKINKKSNFKYNFQENPNKKGGRKTQKR